MSWLILFGIIALLGVIVIIVGNINDRIGLAQDEARLKAKYDARRTYGPYQVGDFYSNGEYCEGMVVSVQKDCNVIRCVKLDSGWDNEIENLPPIGHPALPTIEELETIARLSSRFLELRGDYFPFEKDSIFTKKNGDPKLYASSSSPNRSVQGVRLFYDIGQKKRVLATQKSGETGFYSDELCYSYLSYEFYRLSMFSEKVDNLTRKIDKEKTSRKTKKKKNTGCVIIVVILVVFEIIVQLILSEL